MRSFFTVSILLALGSIMHAQAVAPYTYQGDVLGQMTYEQFLIKDGALKPDCVQQRANIEYCMIDDGTGTNAGVDYVFVNDRLASVTFLFSSVESLAGVISGLTAKFGSPVQTTEQYQNAAGASVTGRVWRWTNGLDEIAVEEQGYGAPLGFGHISFHDNKLMDAYVAAMVPKITF